MIDGHGDRFAPYAGTLMYGSAPANVVPLSRQRRWQDVTRKIEIVTDAINNRECIKLVAALGFALLGTGATVGAAADEAPDFAAVLAANPPVEVVCSYTATSTSSEGSTDNAGETRRERYTAGEAGETGNWHLVSVNGAAPTAAELAEYAEQADWRVERDEPVVFDLASVAPTDWTPVDSADSSLLAFSFVPFVPLLEMGENVSADMRGTMFVAKKDLRVRRMTMELKTPISPAMGVKVYAMKQEMTFTTDPLTNALLLQSMSAEMRGKAFLVKKIEQQDQMTFSDFECQPKVP